MSRKTFLSQKNILIHYDSSLVLTATLTNTGVTADDTGNKVIKAGTPVGAATSYLTDATTQLSVASDSTAQGVVLHDVNVTAGNVSTAVVFRGDVYADALDDDVKALLTSDVKKALTNILFVGGQK